MTKETSYLSKIYPFILAVLFMILFIILAINPLDRDVWIVEDTPIVITFIILAATFKLFRFTNAAYTLMSVWMFWHTVGGHYTFANVPFNFITDLFGFHRNNFDRVGHFVVGLYAFSTAELLTRKKWSGPVIASFFGLFFIMSIAAWYEILEWIYAVTDGGQSGIEFLGSQGDIWDAQKDMLFDMFGALFALLLFWIIRPDLKTDK
ncbi:DUF2238 domain-containing protein [bacterium]|nr:DUF2238 domain-containing protein [bacterium]MBU1884108.1 DUF2238 domain-containing protein [bacterium]